MRHPIILNRRLFLVDFEKRLLAWSWTKLKEIGRMEMLDIGIELFLRLINTYDDFKAYIRVHVGKLDTIRVITDGFIVAVDYYMDHIYDSDKIENLLDALCAIHSNMHIPWQYFPV